MRSKPKAIKGVVSTVIHKEKYVVTYPDKTEKNDVISEGDSITFSLENWTGESQPKKGQLVLLQNVTQYGGGWRAEQASPIRL
jgi:hypothetical protein